jgi:hypothetical protein
MEELDRIAALLAEVQRSVELMRLDAGAASAPATIPSIVDPRDERWKTRKQITGVSRSTVDRWIAANDGKIGRIGGRVYIWMPAFEARGRPGSK